MMIRKLFLNERFIAVTEDDSMVEYIPVIPDESCGDILLGRVERMMPGMNSAFIGIGRKRSGYMPLKETAIPLPVRLCNQEKLLLYRSEKRNSETRAPT